MNTVRGVGNLKLLLNLVKIGQLAEGGNTLPSIHLIKHFFPSKFGSGFQPTPIFESKQVGEITEPHPL